MIKKYTNVKWKKERREAFKRIKEHIAEAPTLWRPNFGREIILYTFAFNHLIVVVLTQKDEVGEEFLVSLMSTGLQGVELNYPIINKQDFALFKSMKHF